MDTGITCQRSSCTCFWAICPPPQSCGSTLSRMTLDSSTLRCGEQKKNQRQSTRNRNRYFTKSNANLQRKEGGGGSEHTLFLQRPPPPPATENAEPSPQQQTYPEGPTVTKPASVGTEHNDFDLGATRCVIRRDPGVNEARCTVVPHQVLPLVFNFLQRNVQRFSHRDISTHLKQIPPALNTQASKYRRGCRARTSRSKTTAPIAAQLPEGSLDFSSLVQKPLVQT